MTPLSRTLLLGAPRLASWIVSICMMCTAASSVAAQSPLVAPAQTSGDSVLKQHYDAAQSFQSAGKFDDAARQYRIFIADALAEMALQTIHVNEYPKAAPLFDEALELAPRSPGLKVRYAQAAYAAHDLERTRTLTEAILRDYADNPKALAKAHLLLGRVLMQKNQEAAARKHFEAAVAIDPNFENGYALAVVCLDMSDAPAAAKIFDEMIAGLGDTAALHTEIGRAYLNSDFQREAIPEFKKALARDANLAGTHYSLALAYLTAGGDASEEAAKRELEAELKLSPNDAATHAQLGNIALRQHRYPDAEQELKRAAALDPADPNPMFYLGQLYNETGNEVEAIAALRKSIALTLDPSQNRFQVQKAHYQLGRLMIHAGQTDAGKQEMQISSALLKRSLSKDRVRLAGDPDQSAGSDEATATAPKSPEQLKALSALDAFEARIAPAIADSYNNLGAIAASQGRPESALTAFERAYEWNPKLVGLDDNWGLAAMHAGRYAEAVPALTRALHANPEDAGVRSELAMSLFMTNDFAAVAKTLGPIAAVVDVTPQLSYMYGVALVKTGEEDAGVKRLLALESSDPRNADVHTSLGEFYSSHKDFAHAVPEFLSAIQFAPDRAIAYSDLGAAQLEEGSLTDAVHNLEMAEKLNPADLHGHELLALAYRKSRRVSDADREQAIYQSLANSRASREGTDTP